MAEKIALERSFFIKRIKIDKMGKEKYD